MRKKYMITLFALMIATVMIKFYIKVYKTDKNEGMPRNSNQTEWHKYIQTANDVSIEMLSADYWISRENNPDEIIMSKMEIELWNEQINGVKFWEGLTVSNDTQYGYTVNRASIRKEPTAEILPPEPDSKYFCDLQVSSILMNEPVVVLDESEDGLWYYVKCEYCEGWIGKENVALCENYEHWKANMKLEEFLLVTGNKEILEVDIEHPDTSELVLYMGTKLELVEYENYQIKENVRVPFECYIVKVPVRDEWGMLEYEYGFVPVSRDVHIGYLSFTRENLINQMFKMNGDRYGWGGMYNARDCSQYVMEIYSLFGFEFARNSAAQAEMPFEGYDIEGLADEEKKEILDKIPIGSLLYFEGHIMLYLGKVDEEYYVISETARFVRSEETTKNKIQESADNIIGAHSCMITPLSIKRPNGNTWLEELSVIRCIQ